MGIVVFKSNAGRRSRFGSQDFKSITVLDTGIAFDIKNFRRWMLGFEKNKIVVLGSKTRTEC